MNETEKTFDSSALSFSYFPAYASYLLKNKLHEFVTAQLKYAKEMNIPLLKFLKDLTEEELMIIGTQGIKEMLGYIAGNNCIKYIESSGKRWESNQLPFITKNQISVEDITYISSLRRKLFREFIHYYTTDVDQIIKILNEIDAFTVAIDTSSFKKLIDLQQQLYKQAQALAHIGNWQWDLGTKKLTWSDEIYRIYELEPQSDILSEKIGLYNHPDDIEKVNRNMQASMEALIPHEFYYRIILKNGVEKTLHAKGEVKLDKDGKPVELYGTLQDVTAQKQNEKQLEDSRNFIEKIANITPCIIAAYNVHTGKYIFINEAVESILGYSKQEMLASGVAFFSELIHPEDAAQTLLKNEQALERANQLEQNASEQVVQFIYRVKHKNGEYRWFQTFGTVFNRDINFKVEQVINVSIDITDNYRLTQQLTAANEEILQKEEQYHRMINEVEDYAILLLDNEGIIQNWNKGAEKIKGYRADEIVGKHFRIFYRQEDQEKKLPETLIERAKNEGKASHEGWRIRKNGTVFWGSILITALHDEHGNLKGFSKVTRNLTEKKLAEDQLREYTGNIEKHNSELIRINKELDSFTYMASHDLQEPLRKIKTFCNFILDKEIKQLSPEGINFFNRITNAAGRMQQLIESLLDYSRTNTMEIKFEPTDLNIVIHEIKEELSEKIIEKKGSVTIQQLPSVNVIALQFRQLFHNIIENSIKYSRENVPLLINISNRVFSIQQNGDSKKQLLEISITDNGIGFEKQYAEDIFKLFHRLHGRYEYPGTGVGLAICKKIVDNHNGTITAASEPGKGSTFTILIPVV